MQMILKDKSKIDINYFNYMTDFTNEDKNSDFNSKYNISVNLTGITDLQALIKDIESKCTPDNLFEVKFVNGENEITTLKLKRLLYMRLNGNEGGITLDMTIE